MDARQRDGLRTVATNQRFSTTTFDNHGPLLRRPGRLAHPDHALDPGLVALRPQLLDDRLGLVQVVGDGVNHVRHTLRSVVADTLRSVVADTLRSVVADTLRSVVADTLRSVVADTLRSVVADTLRS